MRFLKLKEQVVKAGLQGAIAGKRLLKLPLENTDLFCQLFYLFAEILIEPALSLIFLP